jgi:7,8-dihydro-6-hydroxymethylpterin-pyrophosphokinase
MNVKFKTFHYDEINDPGDMFRQKTFKYPRMNDFLNAVAEFASTIEPTKLINICTNTDQNYDTIRNRIVVTVWYWDNL